MNFHVSLDRNVNQPKRWQVPWPQLRLAKGALNSLFISVVFGLAVIAGVSMNSVASADGEVQNPVSDQATSSNASEWKGPDIAAYGDRFKATMELQEREVRKPDWSWHDQDGGESNIIAKGN